MNTHIPSDFQSLEDLFYDHDCAMVDGRQCQVCKVYYDTVQTQSPWVVDSFLLEEAYE